MLISKHSRWYHVLQSSQAIDEPSASASQIGQFSTSAIELFESVKSLLTARDVAVELR